VSQRMTSQPRLSGRAAGGPCPAPNHRPNTLGVPQRVGEREQRVHRLPRLVQPRLHLAAAKHLNELRRWSRGERTDGLAKIAGKATCQSCCRARLCSQGKKSGCVCSEEVMDAATRRLTPMSSMRVLRRSDGCSDQAADPHVINACAQKK